MDFGRIWAKIDFDALRHNLTQIKNSTSNKKILLAIKADAYGHSAKEIALELQDEVAMLGVAGVEEGISLRYGGVKTPILILSPIPYSEIDMLWEYDLIPTVSEMGFAKALWQSTKIKGADIHIHIEIDTGMGRTGLDYESAFENIQVIASYKSLIIDGIYTHFPSADSDWDFTLMQIEKFESLIAKLRTCGFTNILFHASNSAGYLNFPNADFDMIRPGLAVYGVLPNNQKPEARQLDLLPVMSLYSRIVNLRSVPPGRSISYDRKYFTARDSLIAVVTAGYGDGYPYGLDNKGEVLVQTIDGNTKRAKIVGNICMDLIMIDVTDIPNVRIGDEVALFGTLGKETISVREVASWAKTIPYEITSRISPRVPRVFFKNQKIVAIRNLLKVIGDQRLTLTK
ncbi:MAG: alanine racemase [candidate division WOR-3 bacterium]|nr:alanine racemase [candidate division WOR-3 bacterium]